MNVLRFQIRLSKVIQLDIPESELGNQIPETLAILTARSQYGFEYKAEVLEETRIHAGEDQGGEEGNWNAFIKKEPP